MGIITPAFAFAPEARFKAVRRAEAEELPPEVVEGAEERAEGSSAKPVEEQEAIWIRGVCEAKKGKGQATTGCECDDGRGSDQQFVRGGGR